MQLGYLYMIIREFKETNISCHIWRKFNITVQILHNDQSDLIFAYGLILISSDFSYAHCLSGCFPVRLVFEKNLIRWNRNSMWEQLNGWTISWFVGHACRKLKLTNSNCPSWNPMLRSHVIIHILNGKWKCVIYMTVNLI